MRFPIQICILAAVVQAGCSTIASNPPVPSAPVPPPEGATDKQWDDYWAARKVADDNQQTPYPAWSYPAGFLAQFARGIR